MPGCAAGLDQRRRQPVEAEAGDQHLAGRAPAAAQPGLQLAPRPVDRDAGQLDLDLLVEPQESELLKTLARFPEVLERASSASEPQQIANYLRELAGEFHTWYNAHKVIVEDAPLREARTALSNAVGQVLANGLDLLGVSAPEAM